MYYTRKETGLSLKNHKKTFIIKRKIEYSLY